MSFGDSFTWGTNVKDSETWQSFLERKVNARVIIFGFESYGVDQAVKYFTLKKDEIPSSKILILGFIDDDLRRNMTSYRKFQQHFKYDFPFTKPRYELRNEKLFFLPNPSKSFQEALSFSDINRFEQLQKDDWYYSNYKLPQFPYLLNFFSPKAINILQGVPDSPLLNSEMKNLFKAILLLLKEEAASKNLSLVVVRYPTYFMFTGKLEERLKPAMT